jgi:hypothetical protein
MLSARKRYVIQVEKVCNNVFISDTVFTVNESTTDYHVTFVEHFPINASNAINTFRVTRSLETFEINVYLNGSNTRYTGYVCVSIEILTSQQETVDLTASFDIQASVRYRRQVEFSPLAVHRSITYNFTLLDNVMNKTNKVLDGSGVFTIKMTASYLIHGQYTLATSQAQFNAKTHTSVNMTYTWTVCNLTLPLVDINNILTGKLFAGLGVAEFYLSMYPGTKDRNLVSIYSRLANPSNNIELPLQVQYTFELIESGSGERAASSLNDYKYIDDSPGYYFNYRYFEKLFKRNSLVTFRYRIGYALNKSNIALRA